MRDRRALIIGSWLTKGRERPSSQRIRSLADRWTKVFTEDRFGYRSVTDHAQKPIPMLNPKRLDILAHLDTARGVNSDTELLIYFVGHSASHGANDLHLILGLDDTGNDKVIALSQLLSEARQARFNSIICVLDTCHAGRVRKTFSDLLTNSFAMFATGDHFAFEANFSDALLRALEQPIRKNDQRIDRRAGGITYSRLFNEARGRLITGSPKDEQKPSCFGDLGDTVVQKVSNAFSEEYNVFASKRTIYGRVYLLLDILRAKNQSLTALADAARRHPAFVLKNGEDSVRIYLSRDRILDYVDFLRQARWVVGKPDALHITREGHAACSHSGFNGALIEVIERHVLPEGLPLARLDEIVNDLLADMIPPTPVRIKERAARSGQLLRLDGATRVALSLLPTTGRYLKGSADAIFPAEVGD